jgi:peptidyl-prolyl cis-trans isomerase SurA
MTLICLQPLFAEVCNRVVAIVNDEVITLHELNKKIKEMTGLAPEDLKLQGKGAYLATRRRILEFLIDERISQEKIKEMGIKVSDRQVDATIEKVKRDNQWTHEDLLYRLEKQGLTFEKYRERMKRDLERMNLIEFEVKSKIIIREEMIGEFYEKHKEEFSREDKVHLAGIFLTWKNPEDEEERGRVREKAKEIFAKLRSGENFGELARRFSEGPGADEGGDLGVFRTDQLEPNLREMIESMSEGGVGDPIIRENGIQIVQLIKREKGSMKTLPEVRDAIYAILYRQEVNKRYNAWIKELRENSYTKIIF